MVEWESHSAKHGKKWTSFDEKQSPTETKVVCAVLWEWGNICSNNRMSESDTMQYCPQITTHTAYKLAGCIASWTPEYRRVLLYQTTRFHATEQSYPKLIIFSVECCFFPLTSCFIFYNLCSLVSNHQLSSLNGFMQVILIMLRARVFCEVEAELSDISKLN
jgi:hypothetical protein